MDSEIEIDEFDTDDERNKPSTSKKTSGYRKQKFRAEWLDLPELKYWLTKDVSNKYMAKCAVCNTVVTSELSSLRAHAKTAKHMKKVSGKKIYFVIFILLFILF